MDSIVTEEARRTVAKRSRRARWKAHRWLSQNSKRRGASLCMHSLGGGVDVGVTASGVTHVQGVSRCASVAACPLCAPVIRERRAHQIEAIMGAALEQGYRVMFLTPTISHREGSKLAHLLTAFQDAYSHAFSGRASREGGYVGQVRAWDYTHGANGWHPHQHNALIFEDRDPDTIERYIISAGSRFRDRLREKWSIDVSIGSRKGDAWVQGVGWKFEPVRSIDDAVTYLTKIESSGWGVGLEMTRNDRKSAAHGGRTPWQLLEAAVEGEGPAAWLWFEYEAATKGRQQIRISRKLAAMFSTPEVADETDEEAASAAPADEFVYLETFTASEWGRYVRMGMVPELLELVEARARSLAPPS